MWLLRTSSFLANLATRIYYDFSYSGPRPPRRGPVLLVANHPNSLVDAIIVSAVTGRGVRYLAKAPLFQLARIGWLLRAVGAIPIHRRIDDPDAVGENVHAFAAVFEALSEDSAVGIFPEGISHNQPALARLKTGAARIALGFAVRRGRTFPLVPIGIVLRDKARFRSEATAFFGSPIDWNDLADRGDEDHEAVRDLTRRIDDALRQVTVNLEQWEDEPLVRSVAEIWQAEVDDQSDPEVRLERIRTTTEILASLRRRGEGSWSPLAHAIDGHRRRLERLRLTPTTLRSRTDLLTALRWTLRRLHILAPLALLVAALGALLYWPAYRLTGLIARLAPSLEDVQSSYKLLIGMVVYPLWTVLLGSLFWLCRGPGFAGLAIVAIPIIGIAGLWTRERWRGAWGDARRYFTIRSRSTLIQSLRTRQEKIARQLENLLASWQASE